MTVRPSLLVAILLYVTLDLCLPGMPGAFVFDASESVESLQRTEGSATVDVIVMPAAAIAGRPPMPPAERLVPVAPVSRPRRPPALRPPRAPLEAPVSSEDPH